MISPAQQSQPQSLAQAPCPQADHERKRQMQEAWKAFRGEFQNPLKIAADQPDDNVISNRCAPIVNKGVSFLFGQVLKVECTDETSEPDTDKQAYVDGLWGDDDEKMTLFSQAGINGGVCGQIFLKLIPPQGEMQFPRVIVMDPLLVRMVTAPDDCNLILAYIIEYPGSNDLQKRQIIARIDPDGLAGIAGEADIDDTWTITNYQRRGQTGVWYQVGEREYWTYPFAPIFTRQNLPNPNESWGVPDLTSDLINQNKVLNFIQSNTSRILKFHAHPKTWGKGFRSEQMSVGVDDLLIIEAPDGTLQNLEMRSDLASSLSFAAIIRTDMDEQSRVPAVSLGRLSDMPRGNISGVALQLLFQPLIEKTVQKQRLYGSLIREVTRAALVLGGKLSIEEYADYSIDLHWQSLLPSDDLQAAQTALLYQQLGVSQSTLFARLGFDADDEAEKRQAEDAQQQPVNGQAMRGTNPYAPLQGIEQRTDGR
jgi:hypothetical protein